MENYIQNYNTYNKKVIYNFKLGDGGIGDCVKFFMFILEDCIKNKKRLYYKKNNIDIEKYIKLKYDMYMDTVPKDVEIVTPQMFYSTIHTNFTINVNEVFYFTDEVIANSKRLFPYDISYVSIHLRLGDKYLETPTNYIGCKEDTRSFSEEKIDEIIKHTNTNIFFCCDNHSYKMKMKEKYDQYNILITNCNIGHTSLSNTTTNQVLDAITEFYIMTNSTTIYAASYSGFSIMAAKFNNIPLICVYL
jgi:hypothetical protein